MIEEQIDLLDWLAAHPLGAADATPSVRRRDKLALWRHEELAPSMNREGRLDDYIID